MTIIYCCYGIVAMVSAADDIIMFWFNEESSCCRENIAIFTVFFLILQRCKVLGNAETIVSPLNLFKVTRRVSLANML